MSTENAEAGDWGGIGDGGGGWRKRRAPEPYLYIIGKGRR